MTCGDNNINQNKLMCESKIIVCDILEELCDKIPMNNNNNNCNSKKNGDIDDDDDNLNIWVANDTDQDDVINFIDDNEDGDEDVDDDVKVNKRNNRKTCIIYDELQLPSSYLNNAARNRDSLYSLKEFDEEHDDNDNNHKNLGKDNINNGAEEEVDNVELDNVCVEVINENLIKKNEKPLKRKFSFNSIFSHNGNNNKKKQPEDEIANGSVRRRNIKTLSTSRKYHSAVDIRNTTKITNQSPKSNNDNDTSINSNSTRDSGNTVTKSKNDKSKLQRKPSSLLQKFNEIQNETSKFIKRSFSFKEIVKKKEKERSREKLSELKTKEWAKSYQSLIENDISVKYDDMSFINYDEFNEVQYRSSKNKNLKRTQSLYVNVSFFNFTKIEAIRVFECNDS